MPVVQSSNPSQITKQIACKQKSETSPLTTLEYSTQEITPNIHTSAAIAIPLLCRLIHFFIFCLLIFISSLVIYPSSVNPQVLPIRKPSFRVFQFASPPFSLYMGSLRTPNGILWSISYYQEPEPVFCSFHSFTFLMNVFPQNSPNNKHRAIWYLIVCNW